jgi:hypothetical protein
MLNNRGQSSTGGAVAGTLIAITIVAVLVGPLATSVVGNSGVVGAQETVSADPGTIQDLEGYDITSNFSADNGGTSLSEGSDYELYEENGSIKFLTGSANVAGGDNVDLTYEYNATDGITATIADLIPLFAGLLILGTVAVRIRQMM